MEKITIKIIENRKTVIIIFTALIIVCGILMTMVSVDNNIFDYLPKGVSSSKALEVLDEEFNTDIPSVRVVLYDVSIGKAMEYKEKISKVDGVTEVTWLDDSEDITKPIETMDQDLVKNYYKDGDALISIAVDDEKGKQAVADIRKIIGSKNAMGGDTVLDKSREESIKKELTLIFAIALPIILVILMLTTSSWFEPLLFMAAILAAVVLNMGTNIFLGQISFITKAAAAILQLAVSMDYAIFVLHRFAQFREQGLNVQDAMVQAVTKSFSSVLSSGITVMVGFAALITMKFLIGADMGIVLTKGIMFSLISILIFFPALTVACNKMVDKTRHRSFVPSFKPIGKFVVKFKIPLIIVFLILIIPSYLAQKSNYFDYSGYEIKTYNTTQAMIEDEKINKEFGESNQLVLMVPRGKTSTEQKLCSRIENLPKVTSIISYSKTVGNEIPTEYLSKSTLALLVSKHYSRVIITLDAKFEGKETFAIIQQIRNISKEYYGDKYYLAGRSASLLDLKNTIISDNTRVTLISIGAILLVLVILFKSPIIPVVLVAVIEFAIWLNLSYTYFTGGLLSYVAYLILGAIQLGSTVDFAILFTNRYIENRAVLNKKESAIKTTSDSGISILTSASILMTCAFILGFLSTYGIISQIGILIGRGALLSSIMVIFVLPALLILFDKLLPKYKEGKHIEKDNNKDVVIADSHTSADAVNVE